MDCMTASRYTVLAGGTGAAKFLRGLVQVIPEDEIDIVVNVGDDTEVWGLHISPDIDSITYALAGKLDTARGWGVRNETFHCLEGVQVYGLPSWFQLGDRDLATHITRTELMRSGLSLSQTVARMSKALGIRASILPATDDPVRTIIETPIGLLGFQQFFVREQWKPDVFSVAYTGSAEARSSAAVVNSIRDARLVIVAPSNPITSIGPVLAVPGIRDALRCTRAPVIAISPLIGNSAFSGPAAKLMQACGYDVSPEGIARCYHDFLDGIVIDTQDHSMATSIRSETIGVWTTNITMSDDAAARRLAEFVIDENRTPAR